MIGRALRAQARSFAGDLVLFGTAVAAFVFSLSLVASLPPELADAPASARAAFDAPFHAAVAVDAAVLAAVYGSFRYTIDRRDGVIAQRLTTQPRWVLLVTRVPTAAIGGAVVGASVLIGGHLAATFVLGGIPAEWSSLGAVLGVGAVAGLWGLGVGLLVQNHLVALFVATMSLAVAVLVAIFWRGAVSLPLLAMLGAFRFELAAIGIPSDDAHPHSAAVLIAAGWVMAALVTGSLAFLKRDVR